MWHWKKDEIGKMSSYTKLALGTSWTHGLIDRLNGIQWSQVQIPLRPTSYSYFKESFSGEYHMYQLISLYSLDYLKKISIRINVANEIGRSSEILISCGKSWVIWELVFSKILGLIFLILLRRVNLSLE